MPNQYPINTRSILATNVNSSGEDVMIFTTLDVETLKAAYRSAKQKVTFDEMYEVPENDTGFYLYDPCHLTLAEEAQARLLALDQPSTKNHQPST